MTLKPGLMAFYVIRQKTDQTYSLVLGAINWSFTPHPT